MRVEPCDPELGGDDFNDPESANPNAKPKLLKRGLTIVGIVALVVVAVAYVFSRSAKQSKASETLINSYAAIIPDFVNDGLLPAFDQNVLYGYNSCEELTVDITTALMSSAIAAIHREKDRRDSWCDFIMSDDSVSMDDTPAKVEAATQDSEPSNAAKPRSYETNNQVKGVDEPDLVKSDGTYIFAGYGNEIVVTNLDGIIVTRITVPGIGGTSSGNNDSSNTPAEIPSNSYYDHPATRQVQALLLYNDIVTAVTYYNTWECDYAICGGNTTAFIYQFNNAAFTLTLLSQIDMSGSFGGARSIGSYAHIITNANVDTWSFTQTFDRCNDAYKDMKSEEYEKTALDIAESTVDDYAKKMMKGLPWKPSADATPSCKNLIKISTMMNQDSTTILQDRRLGGMSLFYDPDFLQSFVQVTSVDVNQGSLVGIKSSVAGAFIAASSPEIYSTKEKLVLASQGYRYEPTSDDDGTYSEYTYMIAFDLSGAVATPKSIGVVDGYFNNQYSLDFYNGFYRIATTIGEKWGSSFNKTDNSYTWKPIIDSTSQVYVLEEQSSELVVVGSLKDLGKGETIQSVRFLGNKGYAFTYRLVDPLLIIDLSSPTHPTLSSELKVMGVSQYMHPIKDDNFLLTVGQETTADGTFTGMQISVFNVADPSSPFEVQKYVVENGNGWASTDVAWDYHAFRYIDESEKLIIPERIYNWESPDVSFDGFVVYKIDLVDGIKMIGNVTHADFDYIKKYCWAGASLPTRSMVFSGDLVTFKSHNILRTSTVDTMKTKVWELNLDEGRNKSSASCSNYGNWVF